ncbi:MAG: hypothetical protein ACOY4R_25900 [Pseudomonadota bacterium]
MKTLSRTAVVAFLGISTALAVTGAAVAQSARVEAGASSGAAEFRDPKTGKVWTPENVGKENRPDSARQQPTSPADKAFDPSSQVASAPTVVVQRPKASVTGVVPITAGPTVPIVTIDGPSLQAIPGDHWLTVLYVSNNSGAEVRPEIGCTFTNGGNAVQQTHVIVPPAGPGERLGVPVQGPRTTTFVDRVLCNVIAP